MLKLHVFDSFPNELLLVEPFEVDTVLQGPSLIYVQGKTEPPLFVASLLHGDETTGIQAIQKLIRKYKKQNEKLPRSLILFLGNVQAARHQVRHLPEQPDYNRIWKDRETPEGQIAEKVLRTLEANKIFCGIDIHNTSGRNPHHSCISQLNAECLSLANTFSQTLVFLTRPTEILGYALGRFAPSVTIEAGQPGDLFGVQHVYDYLEKCLRLESFPKTLEDPNGFDLYQTVARIEVPPKLQIGFSREQDDLDFCFIENLDLLNFSEMPEKTLLGWRLNKDAKLLVKDQNGNIIGDRFLDYPDGEIRLKRSIVPAMLTQNKNAIYQDCLGYIMERYSLTNIANKS